jgi:hypothetical protein
MFAAQNMKAQPRLQRFLPNTDQPTPGSGGIQPLHQIRTYSEQLHGRDPSSSNDKWNCTPDRQEKTTAHHRNFGQAATRRNQGQGTTHCAATPQTTNPRKAQGLSHTYVLMYGLIYMSQVD